MASRMTVCQAAQRDEIIGLVGNNAAGSGKTKTMSIITNCLAPDGGSVMVGRVSHWDDPVKLRSNQLYSPCGLRDYPRRI